MAVILKIEKRPYFSNRLTDLHNICHGAAFLPSKGYGHLSELRDSPQTSALKRGATPIDWLVPICLIWNDTKWHKCR